MKIRVFRFVEAVRASYWFVPSVMAALAIALGAFMVWVDASMGDGPLDAIGWYQSAKPDGAHQVLSTIAGSMITVAGVVFSITIVAVSYASSQYGPRMLTNFMADRGNQVTLGTFIATFVYCLVVLRTIRGGDDSSFVPQLAIIVGILLALCSIAVLIYFIHHVTQIIHINNVTASIGRQLIDAIEGRFPGLIGDPLNRDTDAPVSANGAEELEREIGTAEIVSERTGYIQTLDNEQLLEASKSNGLVIRLLCGPGDYIHRGRRLVLAWPTEAIDPKVTAAILSGFVVGNKRTPHGDLNFLVDELVEIAARALSSGVNDPFTAMSCIDWLGAGASEMARRRAPSPQRVDDDGVLRVVALPDNFPQHLGRGFGQLRPYVASDLNTALHFLHTLREIARACKTADQFDALTGEAEALVVPAEAALDKQSASRVVRAVDQLLILLDDLRPAAENQLILSRP